MVGIFLVLTMAGAMFFYHNLVVKAWFDGKQNGGGARKLVAARSNEMVGIVEAMADFTGRLIILEQKEAAPDRSNEMTGIAETMADFTGRLVAFEQKVGVPVRSNEMTEIAEAMADFTGRLTTLEQQVGTFARSNKVAGIAETMANFTSRLAVLEQQADAPQLLRPNDSRQQASPSTKYMEKKRFFWYAIKPNSTLWTIAEKYYGRGVYYPILMEHNPGLGIMIGKHSGRIRILNNGAKAVTLFRRLFFSKMGQTFFRYKVGRGDTWRGIAWKFYGDRTKASRLRCRTCPPATG